MEPGTILSARNSLMNAELWLKGASGPLAPHREAATFKVLP